MAWTSSGSILLSSNWQYTEPIPSGSFFRLKHTEAPNGGLFAIAQCEVDAEGKLSLIDSQVLAVERTIIDVVRLDNPGCFAERRIAIKKLPRQPSLQQELRRLFLPGYLQPFEEEIRIVSRSNWTIDIEVSDFVATTSSAETGTGTGTGTRTGTGTGTRSIEKNPLIYIPSALEAYTYYENYYTLEKINDNDTSSGVMKTGGGTPETFKLLVTFDTARIINQIILHLGQFNGYFNFPAELKIYAGNGENTLLLATAISQEGVVNIDTSSDSNFAQALSEYTFVFSRVGNNNISINELDLFGV